MGVLLVPESRVGVAVASDSLETWMRSCRSSAGTCTVGPPWFGAQMVERGVMSERDCEMTMRVKWGDLPPG